MAQFEVFVSKADFKFNCAHFIVFEGFRERLHGHNYQMSVKVTGDGQLGSDGYLIDFGDIKKVVRNICKGMNEFFICPMRSPELIITEEDGQVCIACPDGARFSFPSSDCAKLPVMHSSAEELSHYFWCEIVRYVAIDLLRLQTSVHLLRALTTENWAWKSFMNAALKFWKLRWPKLQTNRPRTELLSQLLLKSSRSLQTRQLM